jgi:hypothetical protein
MKAVGSGHAAVLLAAMAVAGAARAQSTMPAPNSPAMPQAPIGPAGAVNGGDQMRLDEMRLRQLNDDRRKKLVADTDRLLELATQLKVAMDAATKNEMSVEVIRKADEIERLAHSVKERMKQ